jgi:signal transduction histidine kinase/DNA-binding NarL/FixJ family response regulator
MHMSIRKFTLLGICLGTVLLFSIYIFLNSYFLTTTFVGFANTALANDVVRTANSLEEEVYKLDDTTVDWAIWDDSVLFMQGKMKNYIKSNLNDRTLDSLHLSFILFVDNNNKIIWAHSESDDDSYINGITDEINNLVFNETSILTASTQENRIHGIANLQYQLMIVTSCPILDSEGKGPRQGMLIMGRQITDTMLKKVSEKIRLKFRLERQADPLPNGAHHRIRTISMGTGGGIIDIYDIDQNNMTGIMQLKDISGKPSLRLAVFGDKDIVHLGAAATTKSSILLAVGGVLLISAILFLVERRILRRIISIKKQITRINNQPKESHDSKQITIPGHDEITALAHHISSYISEINNYKLNLEQIVSERTNDLQQKIYENELIQKELKQAKDFAEEANRTKSDFLAKVTHEIRTPMNAVTGMNDYLLTTSLDSDQIECLSIIKESSNHLLTIVNDLLDLSKIEAGKLIFEHIDFNLKHLIDSTLKILHPLANKKKLGIHVDYRGNVNIAVKGDPARIRQILFNLANNALKFTPVGDVEVIVTSTWSENDKAYDITVSVKDTGIGIAEEALQRIFEPFIQSDNSTTRMFGGTGLGLSISKQLVTLMGGTISVSSEPNVGSEFTFSLLLQQGDADLVSQYAAATPFPYTPLDRMTILVVDDNEMNLRVAKKVFSLLNQDPVLANGGKEALTLLKATLYDIVFLDIEMPELNGLELTSIIRNGKATPLNQDIHIVAMTAYSLDTIRDQCLQHGMNDFITKPLDPDILYEKLRSVGRKIGEIRADGEQEGAHGQTADSPYFPRALCVLNTESALNKLGGDKKLYLDICKGFLEKFNSERLEVLCIEHMPDTRSLSLYIHTLKGLSLQIGAEQICFIIEKIEENLTRYDSDMHQDIQLLKDKTRFVEASIRSFMNDNKEISH